ncbi:hypothetical protein GCM10010394_21450 [Streptomyces crystallinus]|uniref:Uncharacterized protein n=1 Tax=Streptomyces crystallinus TaxID=68191 RepID=A0ABN1FJ24_9ACTN
MSAPLTGVLITTGGMGRDPGMLIRIRVVSVVSVFGSSGSTAAASGASCAGECGVPYGGVPDGYAAPPRPWGPEVELSVSRLKAGSLPIGSATRSCLVFLCAGGSAARTTILAAAEKHRAAR